MPDRISRRKVTLLQVHFARWAGAFVAAWCASTPMTAQQTTIASGIVVDSLRRVVVNAEVVLTEPATRAFTKTSTDSSGRFNLRFRVAGASSLVLFVSHPAFGSIRRNVSIESLSTAQTITLPARSAQLLVTVAVAARRIALPEKPDRDAAFAGVGGGEQQLSFVVGASSPRDAGDLQQLALLSAVTTRSGLSPTFLGAASDQNGFASDGLGIGGGRVPRYSKSQTKLITSAYDINLGGFSGVLINSTPAPAQRAFTTAQLSVFQESPSIDDGRTSLSRDAAAVTGVGGGWSGFALNDRVGVNISADLRLSSASRLNSSRDLRTDGVFRDIVDRLVLQAGRNGFQFLAPGTSARRSDFLALMRLDGRASAPSSLSGIFSVEHSTDGTQLSPYATWQTASKNVRSAATAQIQITQPIARSGWLVDFRSGVRLARRSNVPTSSMPNIVVSFDSDVAPRPEDISNVELGGTGSGRRERSAITGETLVDVQRLMNGGKATLKLIAWTRFDRAAERQLAPTRTRIVYGSISDFEANRPSILDIQNGGASGAVGAINGALGASTQWELSKRTKMYGGIRVDASRLTRGIASPLSPLLPQPSVVPNISVNPRLGVDIFTLSRPPGWIVLAGPLAAPFFAREPLGILRFGAGRFQGRLDPGGYALAGQLAARSPRALRCLGNAIPEFSWRNGGLDPFPAACNGTVGPTIDSTSRQLALPKGYSPPATWRATASYSHRFPGLRIQYDGRWARNVNQPLITNQNFAAREEFSVCAEVCRPVYVAQSEIDTRSGSVSPVTGRLNARFGDALVISRAQSGGSAVSITVSPQAALLQGRAVVNLVYTLSHAWTTTNGFTSSTFGDPRRSERIDAPSDARHAFALQLGYATSAWLISLSTQLQSGLPFQPLVSSDINGDGFANDRAVLAPADSLSDAERARFTQVVVALPRSIRSCVESARRSSLASERCRTPWSILSQMRVEARYGVRIPNTYHRLKVALQFENPFGALARASGWNSLGNTTDFTIRDPVLLVPRSFSAGTQPRFRYDINPSFGQPVAYFARQNPSRFVLDMTLDLTAPPEVQLVRRTLSDSRRGEVRTSRAAERIREAYTGRMMPFFDRLGTALSNENVSTDTLESLGKLEDGFRTSLDSLWKPVSDTVVALSTSNELKAALDLVRDTEKEMWSTIWPPWASSVRALIGEARVDRLSPGLRAVLRYRPGETYTYFSRE